MNLIYTFTKKLSKLENLDKIVEVYYESYNNNIRFHNIILYTDNESKHLFEDYFHDIRIKDIESVCFLDDFKFNILPELTNDDLLFDGDIFLTHSLKINNDIIVCDRIVGNVLKDEFYRYYSDTVDIFLKYEINNVFDFFSKDLEYVPNIGILRFNNQLILNEFLNHYWKLVNWYKDMKIEENHKLIQNDMKVSAVFGQYFLGLFLKHKKLNISYCNENNKYTHLSGDEKFKMNFLKTII
jgi:hypothetical protein